MVVVSGLLSFILGLPLGIYLTLTDSKGLKENTSLHNALGIAVNIGRSIPFAILMIALIPFTRWVVGTSIGTTAAIVPLTLAAAPLVARLVERALKEVSRELVEAAIVMKASTFQIITKVLIPESLPSLIAGATLTLVNLIGYRAMAGLVGGGGLGRVAIQYGYQRFNGFLMIVTLILLLILVEVVQWLGNFVIRKINLKRGVIR